ncbi:NAD(P)H-dependent oxidoreductase [Paraconexibacter antarcticus]|uniref:NAD(P)H-dependent oxidoreductase n=1 Tax=Paraconexibacter antarcticus TaxID=2949664 RepID=A0ABY5DV55_9ACTN|nr:NAD(P)H-dependent oxidoreductase [Paraconexibacter antarcticus]UTI64530.1 NAD(P)H-dependent oxidoreductase [Paraconexibacter antarcticus]
MSAAPGHALIVHANPEPVSFGAALRDHARATLEAQGMTVEVSDLYAMGFDPVAKAEDFSLRRFPERLWYDREQQHAVRNDALPADVEAEIGKLRRADLVLFVFPLWWFSVPAILKGWFDRVLVKEVAYGGARRYEDGGFAGKRAMLVTTTNAWPGMTAPDGLMGDIDVILWPLQNGVLAYTGFDVLPPLVAHAVAFVEPAEREAVLRDLGARLGAWRTAEAIPFHRVAEVGEDWRLRPDVEPRLVAHRR